MHRAEHLRVEPVGREGGIVDRERADLGASGEQSLQWPQARGQRASEAKQDRTGDTLAQLGGRPLHERQRAVQERGVLQTEVDIALTTLAQSTHGVLALGKLGGARLQLGEVVGERQQEDLLLGFKGAIDQRLVQAGRTGDLVDRRAAPTALVEQGAGGGDDRPLPSAMTFATRGTLPALRGRHCQIIPKVRLLVELLVTGRGGGLGVPGGLRGLVDLEDGLSWLRWPPWVPAADMSCRLSSGRG